MGMLYGFLIVLEVLISFLLIVVIFMQKTKGGMGGSAFGGGAGEAIFGSRMGNVLTKATVVLGCAFLANTLLLTVLTSRRTDAGSVMDRAGQQAPPPAARPPSAPPTDQQVFDIGDDTPFATPDVAFDLPEEDDGMVLDSTPDGDESGEDVPPALEWEEPEPPIEELSEPLAPESDE